MKDVPPPPEPSARASTGWWIALLPVLIVLGVWLWPRRSARSDVVIDHAPPGDATPSGASADDGSQPGAPGRLELRNVVLAMPQGHATASDCDRQPFRPWVVPVANVAALRQWLSTTGVTPEQRDALVSSAVCDGAHCTLTPPLSFVGALGADARRGLYNALAHEAANELQRFPFRRLLHYGRWEDTPGLRPVVRDVFRSLSWVDRGAEHFVDVPYACSAMTDPADREQFNLVLRARFGLEADLVLGPEVGADAVSDESLSRWWGRGGRRAEVLQRLRAARSADLRVPVRELLPPMPRARVNTFPGRTEIAYDCFWTALHFFDDNPSTSLPGTEGLHRALESRYHRIAQEDARFGDMLVFFGSAGIASHAVNLVAPGVVFTKNGGSFRRPWSLMRLDEVREMYPAVTEIRAYRRR